MRNETLATFHRNRGERPPWRSGVVADSRNATEGVPYSVTYRCISDARNGISVMEVLISIAIVSIGLLGVIAMLPVGHLFVQQSIRSDHTSALAEKGFNDIMLHGWLSNLTLNESVAVDPLYGDTAPLAGSGLNRDSAGISLAMAKEIFIGTDDVTYKPPAAVGDLPQIVYSADSGRSYYGRYSILTTVVPQGAGSRIAKVSVAAFFNRQQADEVRVPATPLGGSDIELTGTFNKLKKNQWILLEDTTNDTYSWHRVIVAADGGDFGTNKTWVTLDGPNIPSSVNGAILFDEVLAVYERTVTIE